MVGCLLDGGANPNEADQEREDSIVPIHHACIIGNSEIVNALLKYGAHIDAATIWGDTALMAAASRGFLGIVRTLLAAGAQIDRRDECGTTALHYAVSPKPQGDPLSLVEALLDAGADVLARNRDMGIISPEPGVHGTAPLHLSASEGYLQTIKLLLFRGADVSAVAEGGWAPIHYAAYGGHVDVVEHLFHSGADLTAASTHGSTPLHCAALSGRPGVVKVLLNRGAQVAVTDESGQTPLHWAARRRRLITAKLLIESGGADPTVKDEDDATPGDMISEDISERELIKYLKDKEAEAEIRN